jgi:lysozyme
MATWHKAGAATIALVVVMSPAGYQMLKSHEGLGQPAAPVQRAYADPYYGWRIATICYGHTAGVKRGDTATMAQCEQFLREDVNRHCALVYDAVLPLGVLLSQGEQDAYCSFAYNLGKFKGTDSVYGRLLKHDDWGACMGLLKYYYSNGQPSRGLWERRYAEYNLCINQLEVKRYGPR